MIILYVILKFSSYLSFLEVYKYFIYSYILIQLTSEERTQNILSEVHLLLLGPQ